MNRRETLLRDALRAQAEVTAKLDILAIDFPGAYGSLAYDSARVEGALQNEVNRVAKAAFTNQYVVDVYDESGEWSSRFWAEALAKVLGLEGVAWMPVPNPGSEVLARKSGMAGTYGPYSVQRGDDRGLVTVQISEVDYD